MEYGVSGTANGIRYSNVVKYSEYSTPALSECGNHLAYIMGNSAGEQKLIIRLVTGNDYSVIFERNLTRLYAEFRIGRSKVPEKGDVITEFLRTNYIKGTMKTINDYQENHKQLVASFPHQKVELVSKYQIRWEPLTSLDSCKRVVILDTGLNVCYVFDLSNPESQLILQNDVAQDFKIVKVDWIGDFVGSEGAGFLAFFYESHLNVKIFQILPPRLVYEINKPQFNDIANRGHYITSMSAENTFQNNANLFTVLCRDKSEDVIHRFEVVKEQHRSVISLGCFKLAGMARKILWSITGKWLIVVDRNMEIGLYSFFGALPSATVSPVFRFGLPIMEITHSSCTLMRRTENSIDNNYGLLQTNEEIILVGDGAENLYILATSIGLVLILVLEHGSKLDGAIVWIQHESSEQFVKLNSSYDNVVLNQLISNTKGIDTVKVDLTSKLQAWSLLSNKPFTKQYYDYLSDNHNLMAVKVKSISNAVYIWKLGVPTQLVTVVNTASPIKGISWHPVFVGLLMVFTLYEIILWSNHWDDKPLVINPRLDLPKTFQKLGKCLWVCRRGGFNLPESRLDTLRIVCHSVDEKMIIVKVKLDDKQFNQLRRVPETFLSQYENTDDSDVDDSDIENYLLLRMLGLYEQVESELWIDDDTNAMQMVNQAAQEDLANDIEHQVSPDMSQKEDTFFGFKKRMVKKGGLRNEGVY